ncbi:mucin-2 protein [Nocardioides cynanchi]|uniref:mucin-2 protein n=1 Tax=Nocardioides cynanchi TaxID=2558918 RepID=UPI001EE31D52|nr:mucin-2 protein [Nocardioides cynanchi]
MATSRHKREPNARRFAALTGKRAIHLAVGAAVVATVPAVGLGILASDPAAKALVAHGATPLSLSSSEQTVREAPISRTLDRAGLRRPTTAVGAAAGRKATARAVAGAHTQQWTTTDLNLWSAAAAGAQQVGEIGTGHRVLVTGRTAAGRVEVVVDGRSRWVTAGYLSDSKPAPGIAAAAGLSMAPCPNSAVEYRLTPGAVYVYRSVCHAFPQITTYGGWAARGEHASGKAIDIMTSDKALGDAIAAFLQAHASELNLYDVIWWDRIWTPVRASEGWRFYGDHGSPTANHMDHVHVSVN